MVVPVAIIGENSWTLSKTAQRTKKKEIQTTHQATMSGYNNHLGTTSAKPPAIAVPVSSCLLQSPVAVAHCSRPLPVPVTRQHCLSPSPTHCRCLLPSPIAIANRHCSLLPPPSKQPLSLSLVPVITAIAADVAADVALLLLPPYLLLMLLRPQQCGRCCRYHPCCRSFYSCCHSLPSLPLLC